MFDLYPRDSAELKIKPQHQTANIAAVAESEKLEAIRVAFPKQGLFAEKEWLLSPDAFSDQREICRRARSSLDIGLFVSNAPAISSIN